MTISIGTQADFTKLECILNHFEYGNCNQPNSKFCFCKFVLESLLILEKQMENVRRL